jgi:hypothetical protein
VLTDEDYRCEICGKTFPVANMKPWHMERYHSGEDDSGD